MLRFTASCEAYDTQFFRTEDDFKRYLESLWSTHPCGGRYEAECLRDPRPQRFPCLMLSAGTRELNNRRDEIQNIFFYDIEIHEGLDTED